MYYLRNRYLHKLWERLHHNLKAFSIYNSYVDKILIPFLYVIIGFIFGKSNENRAFYSYTDVLLAYLVLIVAIWVFVISYRENQGHIGVTLFTWLGKVIFNFSYGYSFCYSVFAFRIRCIIGGILKTPIWT